MFDNMLLKYLLLTSNVKCYDYYPTTKSTTSNENFLKNVDFHYSLLKLFLVVGR